MKLTKELKNKIDAYFDTITPEDLYKVAVTKYNFSQVEEVVFELDNNKFETISQSVYYSENTSIYNETSSDSYTHNLLVSA